MRCIARRSEYNWNCGIRYGIRSNSTAQIVWRRLLLHNTFSWRAISRNPRHFSRRAPHADDGGPAPPRARLPGGVPRRLQCLLLARRRRIVTPPHPRRPRGAPPDARRRRSQRRTRHRGPSAGRGRTHRFLGRRVDARAQRRRQGTRREGAIRGHGPEQRGRIELHRGRHRGRGYGQAEKAGGEEDRAQGATQPRRHHDGHLGEGGTSHRRHHQRAQIIIIEDDDDDAGKDAGDDERCSRGGCQRR